MSGTGGFKFTGIKKKVEKAPEILRNLNETDMKPGPMTTVVRGMFERASKTTVQPRKIPRTQVPVPKVNKPVDTISNILTAITSPVPKKFVPRKPKIVFEDPNLEEMAKLIREEETKNPYENPAGPEVFIPETRRGFSKFIKETYDDFMLEPTENASPTEAGDKYPYQKFIREYMRQSSPYRGILTYHGLGSGKTCTAIATSEATV